jgi:hypothetical protein
MLIRLSAAALLFVVLAIPFAMAKDASHRGRSKCLCDLVNRTGWIYAWNPRSPRFACMPPQACVKKGDVCVGPCKAKRQ